MKLKTWILLGYILMALIVVLLSSFSIYFIDRLNNASSSILKDNYLSIQDAYRMIDNLDRIDNSQVIRVSDNISDKLSSKRELDSAKEKFETELVAAENNITEPGEKELLISLRSEYSKYIKLIESSDTLKRNDYYSQFLPQYKKVKEKCFGLLQLNEAPILVKNEYSKQISKSSEIYMLVITAISLLIVIIAVVKIPGTVIKPILALTRKAGEISEKKYAGRLEVKSDNELGKLVSSFNVMAQKLEEYEASNIEKMIAEKKRAEAIVENMRDGVIVTDEKDNIILVNNVASELIGLGKTDLTGFNIQEKAKDNNLLQNLINESGKNSADEKLNYIRIVFKDREEYFMKEINRVFDDTEQNKNLGTIIVLKNITGFKELDEIKNGFISTVSHELKTPLAAMNMSLRLLQDKRMGELNPEQKKITESMKEEVQRLLKMVSELLNLSKLESGGEIYKYQKVSVDDLIDSAITPMLMQFEQNKLNFEMDIEQNLPKLNVDANKVAWVLINLLGNAVRYTSENGNVKLFVRKENASVLFCVKDNGIGIKPEYISRIFDKFVQVNHANIEKQNKGIGLGLAIAKEFVEAHHGKIWVKSEPGKGSEFYFTIPIGA